MKKLSKKGDKLKPNWFDPYEVAECLGDNNYRLKKKGKNLLKSIYSSTRLKLYKDRGVIIVVEQWYDYAWVFRAIH